MLSDRRPIRTEIRKVITVSTATIDLPGVSHSRRSRTGRPQHLRLVGEHERAASRRVRRAGALRITRRGRLAVTSTVTLVAALVVASFFGLLGPAGATSSVVVQPGMTLSQIAREQLPGVPLSQAVTDIQRANDLSSTSIAAGQELVIPGR